MRSELLRGMRRPATLVAASVLLGLAAAAPAQASFGHCISPRAQAVTCETLAVPLDRSGHVPGTVHLSVQKETASPGPSSGAIVALAGGPGQAALPFLPFFARALAPGLATRDLVVFDERGTGASDRLDCPGLAGGSDADVQACARHLGSARAFYTSRDTADDIEAVRQSLGVDKITLFGISYGTYGALTYARRYPQHVEALVLDSIIASGGRDPFDRTTHAAFRRVVRDICSGDCSGITNDPLADLTRIATLTRNHRVHAHLIDADGHQVGVVISRADVRLMLSAGDFDPTVRAEVPGALASAVRGDRAPLARLIFRAETTVGGSARTDMARGAASGPRVHAAQAGGDSEALFLATACEEIAFPWSRTAPLSDRPAQLRTAINQVPDSTFAPFDRSTELAIGTSRACLRWPDGSATSPVIGGPVPDVPVLLLDGVDDTRTPVEDALGVTALFHHPSIVPVPDTGHSVLGTDLSSCSGDAVNDFFAGRPVSQCIAGPKAFPPVPRAPTSARRLVSPPGLHGKRGRTVTAAAQTADDALEQAASYALQGLAISAGGLRGGTMRGSLGRTDLKLKLKNYVYVPGVKVSGTVRLDLSGRTAPSAKLTLSGSAAEKGNLTFTGSRFSGKLGGHRVHSQGKIVAASFKPTWWRTLTRGDTLQRLRSGIRLARAATP